MRAVIFALLSLVGAATPAHALTTAFSYQGELYNAGMPVNANYDFRFILYSADIGGTQIGDISESANVPVVQGVFTVFVDFGDFAVSGGEAQYVEIAARPSGVGSFAIMSPRQQLLATPQALSLSLPYRDFVGSDAAALSLENAGQGPAAEFRSATNFASVYISTSGDGQALRADTSDGTEGSAVVGINYGDQGYGGQFEVVRAANPRAGLYTRTAGSGQAADFEVNANTTADAIFARTTSNLTGSYAAVFSGPVQVNCSAGSCNTATALQVIGTLSKSAGTFRIDHPLDPENKYLSHSFVESPDMKNIYDGTVVLDGAGAATVTLPAWFEALNRDYRYLLTAIGAPSPNLHVSKEMQGNTFAIAGGTPHAKVSWQVTGIRHDAYAKAHPTPVEDDKRPEDRGRYLTPEAFGKSASLGIGRDAEPPLQPMPPPPRQ